jgi:hypothetical protein
MSDADRIFVLKSGDTESSVTARPKTFSTGSVGFMVFGKIIIDGKRYQFTGNAVEIGSKPKDKK